MVWIPNDHFPSSCAGGCAYVMHVNAAPIDGHHGMGLPMAITVERKGDQIHLMNHFNCFHLVRSLALIQKIAILGDQNFGGFSYARFTFCSRHSRRPGWP
jgi:hypothetical protein